MQRKMQQNQAPRAHQPCFALGLQYSTRGLSRFFPASCLRPSLLVPLTHKTRSAWKLHPLKGAYCSFAGNCPSNREDI
jgi:hypothetical protein